MSQPASAPYSYDAVPYTSWPYPQSHPDRLATMATLFGLKPQPVDHARVLELGCASGGNLIPMAVAMPESHFIGIELSARQLAEGQETVRRLGLTNIELHQKNILEVGPDLGRFHYILAHGVYSWVPEPVQDKILAVCQENLEPGGVAYVSYNRSRACCGTWPRTWCSGSSTWTSCGTGSSARRSCAMPARRWTAGSIPSG